MVSRKELEKCIRKKMPAAGSAELKGRGTYMKKRSEIIKQCTSKPTEKEGRNLDGMTKRQQKYVLMWFFIESIDEFKDSESEHFYEILEKHGLKEKIKDIKNLDDGIEKLLEIVPFEKVVGFIKSDYNRDLYKETDFDINGYFIDTETGEVLVDVVFSIKDLCLKSYVGEEEIARSKDFDSSDSYMNLVKKTNEILRKRNIKK